MLGKSQHAWQAATVYPERVLFCKTSRRVEFCSLVGLTFRRAILFANLIGRLARKNQSKGKLLWINLFGSFWAPRVVSWSPQFSSSSGCWSCTFGRGGVWRRGPVGVRVHAPDQSCSHLCHRLCRLSSDCWLGQARRGWRATLIILLRRATESCPFFSFY